MILDFLLKALRRARRDDQWQQHAASAEEINEAIDPMNPFPDPVVIEFTDYVE